MKRRVFAMVLALVLAISALTVPVCASAGRKMELYESAAYRLRELGLFRGVSETNFDLERAPSRLEALVMLIRVLGREQEALEGTWQHPFTDVPAWADSYVGFAYENGLTNGISATTFGTQAANAQAYLTFMLRALGYSDKEGKDFTWNDPFTLAHQAGILPETVDVDTFWRADAALISYAALPVCLNGSTQTLAEKLIDAGCFSEETYATVYSTDLLVQANTPQMEETETANEPEPEQNEPLVPSENFHGKYYTGGSHSKCFHYEANCAGKNSHEITEAQAKLLQPCGKCVLH